MMASGGFDEWFCRETEFLTGHSNAARERKKQKKMEELFQWSALLPRYQPEFAKNVWQKSS
jgi:tryptophan 2,3-dioxygenase